MALRSSLRDAALVMLRQVQDRWNRSPGLTTIGPATSHRESGGFLVIVRNKQGYATTHHHAEHGY
jgi:hypothetical protein